MQIDAHGSTTVTERRQQRSADPITALHYQLAAIRRTAGLEALVLVDDSGCLVAGAGAWPACEELAAYAPLLEDPSSVRRRLVSARLAELSTEVECVSFEVLGGPVVLSARGGDADRVEALMRAADGVRRILAS
jgi:hypothetical protein